MLTIEQEEKQYRQGMGKIAFYMIEYKLGERSAEETVERINGILRCWGMLTEIAEAAKDWDVTINAEGETP